MKLRHALVIAVAALAMPAGAGTPSLRAVDAVLAKVYGPYARETDMTPDWERPVWSREMRSLFDAWQDHIGDALTGLNDYGWFCECQDWDQQNFSWQRESVVELDSGRIEVSVLVDPGWEGRKLPQRLILRRENRRWVIDDLISEAEPDGLMAALRREISEPLEEQ